MLSSLLAVIVFSAPEQIIPVNDGTTWRYNMVQEAGPGSRLTDDPQNETGILRAPVIYRIHGQREIDGRKLFEFEMHRDGRVTSTDLMTIDEQGMRCWARINEMEQLTKLDPPLPIVAAPVAVGNAWDYNGEPDGTKTHQHYEVVDQAEVTIPAGTFNAFHIHGEQTLPGPMTIDRWFVPGVGIVKDITETRSNSGELLRRITLELTGEPEVTARPVIKAQSEFNKLKISLGPEAVGDSRTEFITATPNIYARWRGRNLREKARIRCVWIAEEVEGVAPPDYTIDEASTTATASDSHGVFKLSRPDDGWAPGIYRVEMYVNGALADSVKLKIARSQATRF